MYSDKLKEVIAKGFDERICIVAFLDILGFRKLVKRYFNPQTSDDEKILENIKSAMEHALKFLKYSENEELGIFHSKTFSDCVYFAIPAKYANNEALALCLMINSVKVFIFHLIRHRIYPRGGISIGPHYDDENMVFSDAIIKAYDLEHSCAVYPRIILDDELVEQLKRFWEEEKDTLSDFSVKKLILVDFDGKVFINPFNLAQSLEKEVREDLEKKHDLHMLDNNFNEKILANVEKEIEQNSHDKSILGKCKWLRELILWNINPESSKIKFEYLLK